MGTHPPPGADLAQVPTTTVERLSGAQELLLIPVGVHRYTHTAQASVSPRAPQGDVTAPTPSMVTDFM